MSYLHNDLPKPGRFSLGRVHAARLGHAAPDARPLAAFVGRLVEQKGVELILDAIMKLAGTGRVHFMILGTGGRGEEDALREIAAGKIGIEMLKKVPL